MSQSKINVQLSLPKKKFHDLKSSRKQKVKNLLLVTNSETCIFCIKSKNNTKDNDVQNQQLQNFDGKLNVTNNNTNLLEIGDLNNNENMKKLEFRNFPRMINKALYSKYSSSQNYYYTKDINDILSQNRTISVINYKDYVTFDEDEEYLKRYYKKNEWKTKIHMLTEYYKFHKDISRLFMMPSTNVLNKYHDKKRRLEYMRVTKILKEEQDNKNGIVKNKEDIESKIIVKKEEIFIHDRILDNLDITLEQNQTKSIIKEVSILKIEKVPGSYGNLAYKPQNLANNLKVPPVLMQIQKGPGRTDKSIEVSNTLQDLNLKLGEIISNSRCHNLEGNYLDTPMNETMTNLNNFLLFLNKTPMKFNFEIQVTNNNRLGTVHLNNHTTSNQHVPKFDNSIPATNKIKIDKIDYYNNEKPHKNTQIIEINDNYVPEIIYPSNNVSNNKNQIDKKNENEILLSTRKMAVSTIPNVFRTTGGHEEFRRNSQETHVQNTPKTNFMGNAHHGFGLMTMSTVDHLQFGRDSIGLGISPSQNNLSKQGLTVANSSRVISKTPGKTSTPTPIQKIKNFDELANFKIKSNVPKSASRENSAHRNISIHPINPAINSNKSVQRSPRIAEDRELLLIKTANASKIQNTSTNNAKQRIVTARNSQHLINFGDVGAHGKSDSSSRNGSFLKKDNSSNKIATSAVMNFIKKDLMEVYGGDLKTTRPHHSRINSQIQLTTPANINFKKLPISTTSIASSQMMNINTFSSKDLKQHLSFADKKIMSSMPTSKRDSIIIQGVQNSARGGTGNEENEFSQNQPRLGTHKHTKSEANLNMIKIPHQSTSVLRGGGGQGITVGPVNWAATSNPGNNGISGGSHARFFDEKSDKTPKAYNYGPKNSGISQHHSTITQSNNMNSNLQGSILAPPQQSEKKGRGKNGSNSPNKANNAQVYTYNQNNIVNIFLNPQGQEGYPVVDIPQKSAKSTRMDKRKDSYNHISSINSSPLKSSVLKSRSSVNMFSTSRKI